MTANLESAFHEAMLDVYRRAKSECGYNAVRFLEIVRERGGLAAARQLLRSTDLSTGFVKLWECGRLDITMEAIVLECRWRPLFTDEEIGVARQRLEDSNYLRLT